MNVQRTLKRDIQIIGTGLHSGRPARLTLAPAAANMGIWFRRVDVRDRDNMIPALWDMVNDTQLSTGIINEAGVSVSTIEHLMAALAGCGVHNAIIDIDGPEVPIMDGSATRFVAEIQRAGLVEQGQTVTLLEIHETVRVEKGDAFAELSPLDRVEIDFTIDFPGTIIGRQSATLDMRNGNFVHDIANCRTFCRAQDVDTMRANGRALGGSLENALVVDGDHYQNAEGPRRADECVRHKILDALGDLMLAGAPILGRYRGYKAGHALTNQLLHKLFSTAGARSFRLAHAAELPLLPGPDLRDFALLRTG
ncbi:MAG: UDP-3-O-[3-hydroxymyristoyl] N-acetylglucosamine deacetylase [Rhodobacteraceae bacterium]|nr:UDP-3-O-[3-hydroxymyristoyl] N-acetylglucosamine deacetylase [Paracoccaceae bacterium]